MNNSYALIENELGFYEISPKPSTEYLSSYYNDKYYGVDKAKNQYNYTYTEEEIFHKRIDSLEALEYLPGIPGKMIEIGFGEGFFLDHFDSLGWNISGVDFTADGLMNNHPHLQDKVIIGDIFNTIENLIAAHEKYDFIVCNNVLEHVIDPFSLLKNIHQLLAPTGMARIVVPNDGSWLQREIVNKGMAEDNYWVCPPDHLNYFTVDSLLNIVKSSQFEIVDALGTFPIDFFLLNSDSNYQKQPSLGRNCHFARVGFEVSLARQSIKSLIEFRRGCVKASIGRDLIVYCRSLNGG